MPRTAQRRGPSPVRLVALEGRLLTPGLGVMPHKAAAWSGRSCSPASTLPSRPRSPRWWRRMTMVWPSRSGGSPRRWWRHLRMRRRGGAPGAVSCDVRQLHKPCASLPTAAPSLPLAALPIPQRRSLLVLVASRGGRSRQQQRRRASPSRCKCGRRLHCVQPRPAHGLQQRRHLTALLTVPTVSWWCRCCWPSTMPAAARLRGHFPAHRAQRLLMQHPMQCSLHPPP